MHLSLNAKAGGATVPSIYRKDSGSMTGIWLCSTLTYTHQVHKGFVSADLSVCRAGQQLEKSNCFGAVTTLTRAHRELRELISGLITTVLTAMQQQH